MGLGQSGPLTLVEGTSLEMGAAGQWDGLCVSKHFSRQDPLDSLRSHYFGGDQQIAAGQRDIESMNGQDVFALNPRVLMIGDIKRFKLAGCTVGM